MLHKETHKGYEIVIDDGETEADDQPMAALAMEIAKPVQTLAIDGRSIDVLEDERGRFSTSFLPYTSYYSIVDLAKAVIDDTAEFDTLSGQ